MWIGLAPGRNAAMRQCDPTRGENPPRSAGSKPAFTSDDFPLAEAPITATNRDLRQLAEQLVDVCAATEEQVRLRLLGTAAVRDRG